MHIADVDRQSQREHQLRLTLTKTSKSKGKFFYPFLWKENSCSGSCRRVSHLEKGVARHHGRDP